MGLLSWDDVAESPLKVAKVHRAEYQREETCIQRESQIFVEGLLCYWADYSERACEKNTWGWGKNYPKD